MIKTQVAIYLKWLTVIGGVETFIYNWCNLMKDTYDITAVIGNKVCYEQKHNLRKIVRTVHESENIECDTLIVLRLDDKVPDNIKYKRKIQMIHGCRECAPKTFNLDADVIIPVSDHCSKSYKGLINNPVVIHNPTIEYKPKRILKLISATRLTAEKGYERMKILAKTLKANNIPYIWYVFSNKEVDRDLFTQMNPVTNIKDYIIDCDYLVQLSNSESFCYSVVESLELGVPVIVTPIPVYDELNIIEDKHRITLNFDMSNIDINKILNNKYAFKYNYDNESIRTKWINVLGTSKPFVKYNYEGENFMKIKMLKNGITLVAENIKPKKDDIVEVTEERAKVICNAGYAVVVEEPIAEAKKEIKEEKKAEAKEEVVEVAMPKEKVEVAKVKKTTTRKKK